MVLQCVLNALSNKMFLTSKNK